MDNNFIETFNLTKIYKLKGSGHREIRALDDISLKIKKGEIFGLLGPNGAGKTTFVRILSTITQPTSGYATIDGINVIKKPKLVKNKIGLMLGHQMVYNRITGYDNLKFFCKIYDIPNYRNRIKEITEIFGLSKWLDQYVELYSKGMKVKLTMCRALLIDPPLLFLDEPTAGMDVGTTLQVIDIIKNLNKTILITSHRMNVIESLCNRLAFLREGKILKVGTQEELKYLMEQEVSIDLGVLNKKDQLKSELEQQDFVINSIDTKTGLTITIEDKKNYKDLFSILSNYEINKFKENEISLDRLFLTITGG